MVTCEGSLHFISSTAYFLRAPRPGFVGCVQYVEAERDVWNMYVAGS